MMADLNVVWPETRLDVPLNEEKMFQLKSRLALLDEYGYTHVALNVQIPEGSKLKGEKLCPIDLSEFAEFEGRLHIYTRATITVSDPSQYQVLAKLQNYYDILAVTPKSEKTLQQACSNIDVDLISFAMTEKLPCFLRHKTLGAAVEKGIKFEACYADLISNSESDGAPADSFKRALFISNVQSLIRASRKSGIVISSGARLISCIRSPSDVINIGEILGLDSQSAQKGLQDLAMKVLLSGRLRRKSFRQTIIADDEDLLGIESEGNGLKAKTATAKSTGLKRASSSGKQNSDDPRAKRAKQAT